MEKRAESARGTALESELYVSDRRWKKAVKLLKASAYFNGRDAINPLDLLLLKDCLWHGPESREIVHQVISEFAVQHAFDQNVISQQIAACKEYLSQIQDELEAQFSMRLVVEEASGILRKGGYYYDISKGKTYSVGSAKGLYKLVLLQSNMSVNESEKGDSRWIYVAKDGLEKVIRDGGGDAYGYVNQNSNMCRIRFDINASDSLVVKDIANRSVLAGLVTQEGLDAELYQQWCEKAQLATAQLKEAEHHFRKVRSDFHGALPHSFVDNSLPAKMESTLQTLMEELDAVSNQSEKVVQRINNLDQYFT